MSSRIRARSVPTSILKSPSTSIHRTDSVPNPEMSAAFCTHVCVSAEQYARSRLPFTPFAAISAPPFAARPARNPTMFAMFPPLTNSPPQSAGYFNISAIHRMVCPSISLAIGDSSHAPQFGFAAAAEQLAQHPDRRSRRSNVSPEPRMRIEQRVIEHQLRGALNQIARIRSALWQSAPSIEGFANRRRRFAPCHRPLGKRIQKICNLIHQLMPRVPKFFPRHRQRRSPHVSFCLLHSATSIEF